MIRALGIVLAAVSALGSCGPGPQRRDHPAALPTAGTPHRQAAASGGASSSKAEALVTKACNRGSARACGVLVRDFRSAGGTSSDVAYEKREQAFDRLERKACDLGDYASCINGDDEMKAKAREILRSQSCGRGDFDS